MMIDLTKLENETNAVLKDSYAKLLSDEAKMDDLASVYRSEVTKGSYEGKHDRR